MATASGHNKTSQNDLVQGVQIEAVVEAMAQQARIFQDIARINEQVNAPTWRIARNDLITVTDTLAETDQADFTSFTTSGVEITPSMYPVRSFVSMELTMDADRDAVQKAIGDHAEVILNGIEGNVLGQISSATHTTDHTGASLDKSKFEAALLLYKKQNPVGGPFIFVGSYRQVHEVIGAYGSAGGAAYSVPGVVSSAVASNPSSFYRGNVAGIDLHEGRVPASGGSDVSGAFMVKGNSLALGFWIMLDYRLTDGAGNGRVGYEVMTFSRYGTGIVRPENLHEVISLA